MGKFVFFFCLCISGCGLRLKKAQQFFDIAERDLSAETILNDISDDAHARLSPVDACHDLKVRGQAWRTVVAKEKELLAAYRLAHERCKTNARFDAQCIVELEGAKARDFKPDGPAGFLEDCTEKAVPQHVPGAQSCDFLARKVNSYDDYVSELTEVVSLTNQAAENCSITAVQCTKNLEHVCLDEPSISYCFKKCLASGSYLQILETEEDERERSEAKNKHAAGDWGGHMAKDYRKIESGFEKTRILEIFHLSMHDPEEKWE